MGKTIAGTNAVIIVDGERLKVESGLPSTIENLASRLGLMGPWQFAARQIRRNLHFSSIRALGYQAAVRQAESGTGRTTRVLLEAVAHLEQDPTAVIAVVAAYSRLALGYRSRVLRWARDLGVQVSETQIRAHTSGQETPAWLPLFVDHD